MLLKNIKKSFYSSLPPISSDNWVTVAWKRLVRGPEAHLLLQPLSKRNWEASRPLASVEQMLTCYSWPSDDRPSLSGKESEFTTPNSQMNRSFLVSIMLFVGVEITVNTIFYLG